ncbi:MAG: hypothetical protein SFU27_01725 [Thermonemataceae bacterium]|nr:hypothetical protein [Thermonemataceae bacterium]
MTYEILHQSDFDIIVKDNFMITHFRKRDNNQDVESNFSIIYSCYYGVDKEFIDNKDAYIKELMDYCGFDADVLNYTMESLYALDEIYEKANNKIVKFPNLFIKYLLFLDIPKNVVWGMIAYAGEVVIKATKGNWVLKKEEYHFSVGDIKISSYIPYIYGKKKEDEYLIFHLVLRLFEDCEDFYLAPRIIAALKFGVSNIDMFI